MTQKDSSVQIFTGLLYLPRQHSDGKWRVIYEVIDWIASFVAVPTHFFKVIIVAESKDNGQEPVAVGAFVLPNQEIENAMASTTFLTPIEAVEGILSPSKLRIIIGRADWSF